jgi:hypothetical protein
MMHHYTRWYRTMIDFIENQPLSKKLEIEKNEELKTNFNKIFQGIIQHP